MRATIPVTIRFWTMVTRTPDHWVWVGYVNAKGYGYFQRHRGDSPEPAHRVAWDLTGGDPVPKGYGLGVLCGLRSCVKPSHHAIARQGRRAK